MEKSSSGDRGGDRGGAEREDENNADVDERTKKQKTKKEKKAGGVVWGADVADNAKRTPSNTENGDNTGGGASRVVGYDPNAVFDDLDGGGIDFDNDGDGMDVLAFAEALASEGGDDNGDGGGGGTTRRGRSRTKSTGI